MSFRDCFTGKMAAGMVSKGSGERLLGMIEQFEREHAKTIGGPEASIRAAMEAAEVAQGEAAVKADQTRRAIIAQADTLDRWKGTDAHVRELRKETGSWGFGNKAPPGLGKDQSTLGHAAASMLSPEMYDLNPGPNVFQSAKGYRSRAHAMLAETIEALRPKNLGLTAESVNGLDLLRALWGKSDVNPEAPAWAQAVQKTYKYLADEYRRVGGRLGELDIYRINNPEINQAKARAVGHDGYKQLVRETIDRERMIDFATNKPMTDARLEQFLDEHANNVLIGEQDLPSAAPKGRRMLANSRDYHRVLHFKDPESWMRFAETVGEHADVFETVMHHIYSMSNDIAMIEHLGPNPEAWKRFVLDLFSREPARLRVETAAGADAKQIARAVTANRKVEANAAVQQRMFENLFAEVTGQNKIPVNTELARRMGDIRNILSSIQLGSAWVASWNDVGTLAMNARFNNLDVANIIQNATKMMAEKGSEIYAAQQGLLLDTLAHAAGHADRISGEVIRTGLAGKLSTANIRLSGLRRWTNILRTSFGMEWMAHLARERGKAFSDLDPKNIEAFKRHGITSEDWDVIRSVTPSEPRPNAILTRPLDIHQAGHRDVAEKLNRLIFTEMDHAVIDENPLARSIMTGQSRPGTVGGELRRGVGMYRTFTTTLMLQQMGRAFARGWDGSRLGHGALTFITMTALGALSMNAKEILAGRDPISLNPTERHGALGWGKAVLQGGGLGPFGDIIGVDQTKHGNTWAAFIAGPQFAAAERILGDFLLKNFQAAAKGKETHFLGDAAYVGGGFLPGSSLWFGRLAFQREVLDQMAKMIDPRAPERFQRMEETAMREWGQRHWWAPGRTEPRRAPDLEAILGR
jgi:hypothetical protein